MYDVYWYVLVTMWLYQINILKLKLKLKLLISKTGLVSWTVPNHYLNQCWNIVDWTLRNKLTEILIGIQTFSSKKMHLKMSFAKLCQFRSGLDFLRCWAGKIPIKLDHYHHNHASSGSCCNMPHWVDVTLQLLFFSCPDVPWQQACWHQWPSWTW